MRARLEPIVGRYIHAEINGRPHRLYYEEAGDGIPLLCLHTAGADGRQYRGVLNDPDIIRRFRVVVFDMPWHGKSSPPSGWEGEEYQLTTDAYTGMILDVMQALELERPVVMGCSIGGRIVLHLALEHAERFRALIGLQSAASIEKYYDPTWLHRADVHGGEVCGGLAYGLMAPLSPDEHRWETVWHYMQGGPGIFAGDLFFYQIDGDIRDRVGMIDTSTCPLYLLTGEYDYSCSPDDTKAAAARIQGAKVTIMAGLGHFPMSENPEGFLTYLRPVLDEIREREEPVA
jgi:pimeloyl-ACP methyl ester carboxylesterase